jgi:hypothetical protein
MRVRGAHAQIANDASLARPDRLSAIFAQVVVRPHEPRREWLKNGNCPSDLSKAPRCGARTGAGCHSSVPLWQMEIARLHGGHSTGPRRRRELRGWPAVKWPPTAPRVGRRARPSARPPRAPAPASSPRRPAPVGTGPPAAAGDRGAVRQLAAAHEAHGKALDAAVGRRSRKTCEPPTGCTSPTTVSCWNRS